MIDATGGALELPVRLRAVVLVEGLSDRIALEAVASRHGRSLSAEGVSVVDMGGATNVGRFLERFGPPGLDVALTGLYDAPAIKNRNMFLPGTEIALRVDQITTGINRFAGSLSSKMPVHSAWP